MNQGVERLSPIEGLPPDPTDLPAGCSFSPRCPYAEDACRSGKIENIHMTNTHECRCIRAGKEEG